MTKVQDVTHAIISEYFDHVDQAVSADTTNQRYHHLISSQALMELVVRLCDRAPEDPYLQSLQNELQHYFDVKVRNVPY